MIHKLLYVESEPLKNIFKHITYVAYNINCVPFIFYLDTALITLFGAGIGTLGSTINRMYKKNVLALHMLLLLYTLYYIYAHCLV